MPTSLSVFREESYDSTFNISLSKDPSMLGFPGSAMVTPKVVFVHWQLFVSNSKQKTRLPHPVNKQTSNNGVHQLSVKLTCAEDLVYTHTHTDNSQHTRKNYPIHTR